GVVELRLVGTLQIPGGSFGGSAFGMAPLPFVQEAFERPNEVSGVSVAATSEGAVGPVRERLGERLGEGLQVERSSTRTEQVASQFQGFNLALLFFAGTSLFVGAFLVFNALSMTVLERTRELGMLRALGSTRAMISRSVVLEAAVLGVAGSIAGVLLGYGMALALVRLFGQAFRFEITGLSFTPFALASAVAVGLVVTVAAALLPALRAGRVSPVEAMRSAPGGGDRGRPSRRAPLLGLLLVGLGAPWIYYLAVNLSTDLDGLVYASGIAGVLATFLGVSLVIPALVRPLAALFSPVLRLLFGVEGRMAAANATRNRGRTALTASALMVGVSLVVAFSALGGSVLGSIGEYLDDSLGSDYVVQPPGGDYSSTFSPELEERVNELPGVESTTGVASTVRREGQEINLVLGVDGGYPEIFPLNYSAGPEDAFSELGSGGAIVGEQFAGARDLGVGDTVELDSPTGPKEYPVAGVLENEVFGGGTGIYISKDLLREDFGVTSDRLLAIKAGPGVDRDALSGELGEALEEYPQFALYSNVEWREEIQSDFDRQYVFFYAIMGVAVAVSAFGVVNTLSMSVFERTREIGILRAVGTTRLQVARLIIDEGIVISLIGCSLGVAVGSLLGYLFVRGSGAGGFEVAFHYPTAPALYALLSGLVIGVFAGLLPARSAARTEIVEAVQQE
nr:ABC transporter permease [Rubrobacter sp.]